MRAVKDTATRLLTDQQVYTWQTRTSVAIGVDEKVMNRATRGRRRRYVTVIVDLARRCLGCSSCCQSRWANRSLGTTTSSTSDRCSRNVTKLATSKAYAQHRRRRVAPRPQMREERIRGLDRRAIPDETSTLGRALNTDTHRRLHHPAHAPLCALGRAQHSNPDRELTEGHMTDRSCSAACMRPATSPPPSPRSAGSTTGPHLSTSPSNPPRQHHRPLVG